MLSHNYYHDCTEGLAFIKYRQVMYEQMLKGKYAEEGNLAGTLGELGLAFTGRDVFQDVREPSHDVIY